MHKMKHTMAVILSALNLILGCWQDRVALFLSGETQPVQLYPVRLELLPQADQRDLREGIPIYSSEQLSRLLEDFLS